MSAWADYRVILRAAMVQRSPRAVNAVLSIAGLLAPLCLVIAVVFAVTHPNAWGRAISGALLIPAALLLLLWLFVFVPGAALMNTPANCRLVPRMRKRLVEMIVAGWVLVFLGALAGAGKTGAGFVTLWVIGVSMGRSGNPVGIAIGMAALSWGLVEKLIPPAVMGFFTTAPGIACLALLVVLLGAWAIGMILPHGGDRHLAQRKRQAESIERMESPGRAKPRLVGNPARGLYARVLAQVCRHGSPRRLLPHALGPAAHWTATLPTCAGVLAAVVAVDTVVPLASLGRNNGAVNGSWWIVMNALPVVHMAFVDQCRRRLGRTKVEQALVRLSPGAPGSGELNRSLAVELSRNVLFSWGVGSATTIALALAIGLPAHLVLIEAALCTLVFAPSVAWVLTDYARADFSLGHIVLTVFLQVTVTGLALAFSGSIGPGAWLAMALVVNAIAGYFAHKRWRKMLVAPVAFPALRLV